MEKIHVIARLKIQNGKFSDFKNDVDRCIAATKTEPGALLYDWFIDEEAMECTVLETYKDSDAVLFHSGNVKEPLSKLMEISDLKLEVFGNPSDQLMAVLKEMNLSAVSFYGGI